MAKDNELTFEVVEDFGVLGDGKWPKHLTKISWNGAEAKYDIRSWNNDLTKMSKGITLTTEELMELGDLIQNILYGDDNSSADTTADAGEADDEDDEEYVDDLSDTPDM